MAIRYPGYTDWGADTRGSGGTLVSTVRSRNLNQLTLYDPLSALSSNTADSITLNTTSIRYSNTFNEAVHFGELLDFSGAVPFDFILVTRLSFSTLPTPAGATNFNIGVSLMNSITAPTNWVFEGVGKDSLGDIFMRQLNSGGSAGSNIVGTDATYNVRSIETHWVFQPNGVQRGGPYLMYNNADSPVTAGSGDGAFLPFSATYANYYVCISVQDANGEAPTFSGISIDYWLQKKPDDFPAGA